MREREREREREVRLSVHVQASLSSCQERIEQLLNNNVQQQQQQRELSPVPLASLTPAAKLACCTAAPQPTTPTDVRDIRVCH